MAIPIEAPVNPEMDSSEHARTELSRKKEQVVIAIGFWEQRVQSYQHLLNCSEAQLKSSRAELKAIEEADMELGERLPASEAHIAGVNVAMSAISSPNWAREIVAGTEERLAHLAAIPNPSRVTLFGPIENEMKVLSEMIATKTSTTRANERIPSEDIPDAEIPLQASRGSIFDDWIRSHADNSSNESSSSHSQHSEPAPMDKQPEAISGGEEEPEEEEPEEESEEESEESEEGSEEEPKEEKPDRGVAVRRGYGGYLPRGFFTRGNRDRRGRGGTSSRGITSPRGNSVTRPGNLRASKRPHTDDTVQEGINSDQASDYQPENIPKRHKQDTPTPQTELLGQPDEDLPCQSPAVTESEVSENFMKEPEGAMIFSRANISSTLGGTPLRTWVQTGQRENVLYKVEQYFCPMRERNPGLPMHPGDYGYIYVDDRQVKEVGKSYELFIPDNNSKEWRYFGKYLVAGTRKVTLAEWVAFPEANQTWWCKQVLKEKWGLQMLLSGELITASEYKTCTLEKVRGFFNLPDGEKNLRLNVLSLVPIGYNWEIYQALIESLFWG